MESKSNYEFNVDEDHEIFQKLGRVEYLVKYKSQKYSIVLADLVVRNHHRGAFTIEWKCDANALIKFEIYAPTGARLAHSEWLVNRLPKQYISVEYTSHCTAICFIEIIQYSKQQNIQDLTMHESKTVSNNKVLITEKRLDQLSSDMLKFFTTGHLSDVILSDGSNDFPGHKQVLSARSSVFSKMFQHDMKENRENRVIISDIPFEVLKELLIFIYSGVVTIKDMKMARALYVAADKYDVKELQAVCSKTLKDVDLDSVMDTLALADLYGDKTLKLSALDFIAANYSAAKKHKQWESFMKDNQLLALEVLSFVLDGKTSM